MLLLPRFAPLRFMGCSSKLLLLRRRWLSLSREASRKWRWRSSCAGSRIRMGFELRTGHIVEWPCCSKTLWRPWLRLWRKKLSLRIAKRWSTSIGSSLGCSTCNLFARIWGYRYVWRRRILVMLNKSQSQTKKCKWLPRFRMSHRLVLSSPATFCSFTDSSLSTKIV